MAVFQPLDIIIFEGNLYNPIHLLIEAKIMSPYVHCVLVKDFNGDLYDPSYIRGIKESNILDYKNRNCVIVRYRKPININNVLLWCENTKKTIKQYDFISLFGFATGLRFLKSSKGLRCDEFVFNAYYDNSHKIANFKLDWPAPKYFVECPEFEIIYKGKVECLFQ